MNPFYRTFGAGLIFAAVFACEAALVSRWDFGDGSLNDFLLVSMGLLFIPLLIVLALFAVGLYIPYVMARMWWRRFDD
jgi:hypothetical protein